jgi:HK97 family phage portal protein
MKLKLFGLEFGINPPTQEKASAVAPMIYVQYGGQTSGVGYKRNPTQYADEAYRKNCIAYKAVSEVARGAAKVPLKVMIGEKEADPSHPLCVLLKKPNPWSSKSAFFEAVVAYLELTGNTYIEGVGPEGKPPLELWALRPDRTKVLPGRSGPAGYVYEVNGSKKTWNVDPFKGTSEVLHMKFFHPLDDWYGMSPLEAAAYSIDSHRTALGQVALWSTKAAETALLH